MKKIDWNGLTKEQVARKRDEFGLNQLEQKRKEPFYLKILHIILEPMFLLLIVAALIYFFLGEPKDGLIMLVFVVVIIAIEVIQEWKTDQTLNALKDLSAPKIKVIREGQSNEILSQELVPGDLMLIEEGVKVPADGFVIKANDLRINESSLTGEAEAVWKTLAETEESTSEDYWREDYVYTGTLVTTGSGTILVDKIGTKTEYGKIGKHLASAEEETTPLDKQIGKLVKVCAIIALIFLTLVAVMTFFNDADLPLKARFVESILSGITIAMAMIPEEFPVVLTVFLSMGAWRLAKKQSLIRKLPAVETMGAVSVLAVDKTGTITENKMTVSEIWVTANQAEDRLIETMGLASETEPYDPMEIAMLEYDEAHGWSKERLFNGQLVKEYPFTDELKMMGHVWDRNARIEITVKGSPESVLNISAVDSKKRAEIAEVIDRFSHEGLRVIAVGEQIVSTEAEVPKTIEACELNFLGLIGLSDLPRKGVAEDIQQCQKAGIKVVMITGDNGVTAGAIARNVGIAMGKRGSEVSREAADLILMDDDFSTIVSTVKDGRRIYDNIKKAIGYIFVIHIPIALTALFGPILGIPQAALLLLPVHVVLLELVIDPTCSVVLERQPSEPDIMDRPPRDPKESILSRGLLVKSVVQGLVIFVASFLAYYLTLQQNPSNDELARTMGIAVLIVANLFLVQVNSSNHLFGIQSFIKLIHDKVIWLILGGTMLILLALIYAPINSFLDLAPLSLTQLAICAALGMVSVCWYDLVKLARRVFNKE